MTNLSPTQKEIEDFTNMAAFGDNAAVAEFLSMHKNAINEPGFCSKTALMLAAQEGHLETARLLLHHGASIDQKGPHIEMSALMLAVDQGITEMVEFLLEKGADINTRDHRGITLLMMAVMRGQGDIAELLLEKGVPVDVKDDSGNTAQKYAEMTYQTELVVMLEKGRQQEQERWVADTDCSRGLKKAIRATRPLTFKP